MHESRSWRLGLSGSERRRLRDAWRARQVRSLLARPPTVAPVPLRTVHPPLSRRAAEVWLPPPY